MRKWGFVLLLALMTSVLSLGAFAEGIVAVEVSPGYGGVMVAGNVVPVELNVSAIGEDVIGKVSVRYQYEDKELVISSEVPIHVTAGSTKEYILPLMMEQNFYTYDKDSFLLVKVLNQNDQIIHQQVVGITELAMEGDLTTGILSDRYVGFTYFNLVELAGYKGNTNTLKMESQFFDEARFLDGLDVLVIDGVTSPLSEKGLKNLYDWVHQGGVLILSTGEQLPTQQGIMSTFNIALSSNLSVANSGPLAGIKQLSDVTSDFQSTAQAGIFVKPYGGGKIILSTYSLSSKGVVENQDSVQWIEAVFQNEIVGRGYMRTLDHDDFRSLWHALNRVPKESMPSVKVIMIIIAGYILLVGPVSYIFLKRKEKTYIYWRLVSMMAVLTTVVIFVAGQGVDFNKTVVNGLTIIDQRYGGLKTNSFLGIKSSGIGDLDVAFDQGHLKWSGFYQDDELPKERVYYYDNYEHVVFKDVKKFQFANVMVEHPLTIANSHQEIIPGGKGAEVRIENPFDMPLRDVVFIMNESTEYVGDIEARQVINIPLEEDFFESNHMKLNLYDFYDDIPEDIEDVYVKNRVVEAFFNNMDRGRYDGESNYMVFGWLDKETSQNVYVNGVETSVTGKTFWADSIGLGIPEIGRVTLPYGTLAPDVLTSGDTSYDNYDHSFYGYGEADFTFQIPDWMIVDALSLKVDEREGMVYKIYNYETTQWDLLTFDDGSDEIELSVDYVSSLGQVRLLALNNGGDMFFESKLMLKGVVDND